MRVVTWTVTAVAGMWMVMSFTYPFGWDQGIFAWVGDVIVRGGMPYRDAWDIKGPLIYYLYALMQTIFGIQLWSVRLLDGILLIVATISMARVGSAMTDGPMGRWVAIFFFLWYASHSYWHTAQPDGWAGMILLMGFAPLLSAQGQASFWKLLGIGLSVGVVTLFKPLYAVFLLLPFIHVAMTPTSSRIKACSAVVAGWTLPIILTAVWFSARGALNELLEVYVRLSAMYLALSPGDRVRGFVDYVLAGRVTAVALPLVVYGTLVFWRRQPRVAILLGSWTFLAASAVVLQNRFFAYHWLPILPPVVLLGAIGLHSVLLKMRALGLVFATVLLMHCVAPIVVEEIRFVAWLTGRIDRETYYDGYGEPGEEMKAVSWLRENGKEGGIYVFGWNTAIAWLSEREVISRFGFSMPLMLGNGTEIQSQYRHELLAALGDRPPRYIVTGIQSERILGAATNIDDFPELADLVQRSYSTVAKVGRLTIHELGQ